MARIRADYVFGTTTAALAVGDTTMASAELARLPAVAGSDVAAVTLHNSTTGEYEVVFVTAHTTATTTANITRAQEGSTAKAWPSGSTWLHGPTAADFTALSGSAAGVSVTPAGAIASTDVQAALEELDAEKAAVGDVASRLVTTTAVSTATTLTAAHLGHVVICSGTTANYTVGLPTAVGNTGETICIKAATTLTKLVTVDGNGSETVAGAATVVLWAGESLTLFSDGANWQTLHRIRRPMAAASFRASNLTITANTLTQVTGMTIDYDTSGLMNYADHIDVARAGLYRVDAAVMWSAANAGANYGAEIHINGVAVFDLNQAVTGSGYPASSLSQMKNLAVGDVLTLKVVQNSTASQSIYGAASGRGTRLALSEVLA